MIIISSATQILIFICYCICFEIDV